MSANKKKAVSKLSKTQELQKKYPGHKPIPPSTRTVVIVLVATDVLSLLMVLLFYKNAQAPQLVGIKHVTLETSMGTIKLELDGDKAPRTVTQFLKNVNAGKYDGLTFHRVMKGFMIQGGDPNGNGTGGGT
ncbi:MAG: peptidylprolyl isomerase, partial [Candidatus Cryosericum sp.]